MVLLNIGYTQEDRNNLKTKVKSCFWTQVYTGCGVNHLAEIEDSCKEYFLRGINGTILP